MGAVATPNKAAGISFSEIKKMLREQRIPYDYAEPQDLKQASLAKRVLEIHSIYRLRIEAELKPLVDAIDMEYRHLVHDTDRGTMYEALFKDGSLEETEIAYRRTTDA